MRRAVGVSVGITTAVAVLVGVGVFDGTSVPGLHGKTIPSDECRADNEPEDGAAVIAYARSKSTLVLGQPRPEARA